MALADVARYLAALKRLDLLAPSVDADEAEDLVNGFADAAQALPATGLQQVPRSDRRAVQR